MRAVLAKSPTATSSYIHHTIIFLVCPAHQDLLEDELLENDESMGDGNGDGDEDEDLEEAIIVGTPQVEDDDDYWSSKESEEH
ncbi:hypothetical protein BJV74DRAFT_889155 [Russula compacta]|nr:hypothetical protein BJV74DRAFT_889155 [Russula compacta]